MLGVLGVLIELHSVHGAGDRHRRRVRANGGKWRKEDGSGGGILVFFSLGTYRRFDTNFFGLFFTVVYRIGFSSSTSLSVELFKVFFFFSFLNKDLLFYRRAPWEDLQAPFF